MTTALSEEPPNRKIAALLGNGVSIAFNPGLALSKINAGIRARLNEDVPDGDPAAVLTEAANKIDTGDPYIDFESLLGPLDQQHDFIAMMAEYARIIGKTDETAAEHLKASAQFVRDVRRTGTSFALEIIDAQSRASWDRMEGLTGFVTGLRAAAGGQRLTIANLNYDSLVMACLSDGYSGEFCDLARGYGASFFEVLHGVQWVGHPLRQIADFPPTRKTRLIHLHGSLTWLKQPGSGLIYRFRTEDLRMYDFWEKWRDGETDWQPVVVLTNQTAKTEVVKEQPYALAYSVTEESLIESDRWLIAGYSFRDECVNEMLARAWKARVRKPDILVIGHGDSPSTAEVLKAIGHHWWEDADPSAFLTIERGGLEAAMASDAWNRWADMPSAEAA
ncbi:hypothetical protein GCM10023258_34250 [Terrabacter aeriphilus]|uniref:SIR2-like domain-containing protein n=1 Tax=Terrabacter aeriphilus TaxID=515662 RepID=A0ABP9JJB3_9MICO